MNATASRPWSKSIPIFHVESVKGRIGDWGYTTDSLKALPLTPYWQRRFAADCKRVGVTPTFNHSRFLEACGVSE